MNNQIPWDLARDLSKQQTQRQPTPEERALRRQSNVEALAAGILSEVVSSRTKFTADECVNFAFDIATKVVERAESAREAIKADFTMSK